MCYCFCSLWFCYCFFFPSLLAFLDSRFCQDGYVTLCGWWSWWKRDERLIHGKWCVTAQARIPQATVFVCSRVFKQNYHDCHVRVRGNYFDHCSWVGCRCADLRLPCCSHVSVWLKCSWLWRRSLLARGEPRQFPLAKPFVHGCDSRDDVLNVVWEKICQRIWRIAKSESADETCWTNSMPRASWVVLRKRERESFEVALHLPVGMIVFASACSINCFDLFLFWLISKLSV